MDNGAYMTLMVRTLALLGPTSEPPRMPWVLPLAACLRVVKLSYLTTGGLAQTPSHAAMIRCYASRVQRSITALILEAP